MIPLNDALFQNLSWASSFDQINQPNKGKEILGLVPVRSNLVWRYFMSQLKQRSNIRNHREKRCKELKLLLDKLDSHLTEEGRAKKQQQMQEIYDKLKKVQREQCLLQCHSRKTDQNYSTQVKSGDPKEAA